VDLNTVGGGFLSKVISVENMKCGLGGQGNKIWTPMGSKVTAREVVIQQKGTR
jgi:hypothetical protein